jgi:hypothetical protein
MSARVVLHLPDHALETFRSKPIYGIHAAIERLITSRGGTVVIAPRDKALYAGRPLPDDGDLHVVENGRARGPGYLNAAVAYLEGYFHLDPEGVLADASIRHETFDPGSVSAAGADVFLARLQTRFAARRHSRYRQKTAVEAVPQGCIAVFLQGPKPERQDQAHLSTAEMLRVVAEGAGGRAVLVKPHPLKPELGAWQIAEAAARGAALIPTGANVHDLLAAACVTVSINSATGFEGFLHATPAIFFGRTDFHQCVETVTRAEEFAPALQRALAGPRDYAKAMYWYFGQHGFWLDDPGLDAKVLAAFAGAGFSELRLGLRRMGEEPVFPSKDG